jgi:hypothetical protein
VPLFMDHHHKVDGLTADAVAGAHQRDLEVQAKHGVNYMKYWFNEDTGAVYCLVGGRRHHRGHRGRLKRS